VLPKDTIAFLVLIAILLVAGVWGVALADRVTG